MNKSTVALIGCDTYDDVPVYEAVKTGLDLLGGISHFIKPGERIVMKPNVLFGTNPQKCVSTHPAVLKAVGRLLLEANTNVYYGDSSGFGKCEANMKKAELKHAADELGIRLADFDKGSQRGAQPAAAREEVCYCQRSPGIRRPDKFAETENTWANQVYRGGQESIWMRSWYLEKPVSCQDA